MSIGREHAMGGKGEGKEERERRGLIGLIQQLMARSKQQDREIEALRQAKREFLASLTPQEREQLGRDLPDIDLDDV